MEIYQDLLQKIVQYQFELNKFVSINLRTINEEFSIEVIMMILGVSFLYGLIHALGPGHGKALVSFYFLNQKETNNKKDAFKLGYLISIVHAISALLITFVIYFILDVIFSRTFKDVTNITTNISAIMIMSVAIYLIYESIKHAKEKEQDIKEQKNSKYMVAISAGIVPCPGVMTIVLFSISQGHIILGIASAIVMSIGMGFTISVAGILTVIFKDKIPKQNTKLRTTLEIFSALLIFGLGFILLQI
jgi:ABC-type nickel/cobalt efflux system permease component RcnA